MDKQFYLQMSGVPGTGKTTVANAIAKKTGAAIIDLDVVKSALLDSTVPVPLASKASYKIMQGVASHLMSQGKSVICDSPCYYENVLTQGQNMAAYYGAAYLYIECALTDLIEIDRRLRTRSRFPSQLSSVWAEAPNSNGNEASGEELFKIWMKNMKRPEDGDYLYLDTAFPIKKTLRDALYYVYQNIKLPIEAKSNDILKTQKVLTS